VEFQKMIAEAEEIGRVLLVGMVLDGVLMEVPL
jgi:hypothetical protein